MKITKVRALLGLEYNSPNMKGILLFLKFWFKDNLNAVRERVKDRTRLAELRAQRDRIYDERYADRVKELSEDSEEYEDLHHRYLDECYSLDVEEEQLITRHHVSLANLYFIPIAKDDWKEGFYHPGRSLKDSAQQRIKREAETAARIEWENRIKLWSPWIPVLTSLLGVLLGAWLGHGR